VVIPDSSAWIDYFSGVVNAQSQWIQNAELGHVAVADLILTEVLQGIREDVRFELVQRRLTQFKMVTIGGRELAVASASNYRTLRKRGITIRSTIDCLIATFCIEHCHILLHNDRDFDPFEQHLGLRVLHPS
jgi:predicted nucleic acid-binding protein